MIARMHEEQGREYLSDVVIAEYFRETDERFYNGGCNKNSNRMTHRMVERFLHFVNTGEIKLPNPMKGCQQELASKFETIAENFITTVPHPNTRNDARWVVHKYFAWLDEQGYGDLGGVGAVQIKDYLLYAAKKYSQNSMRSVRLYLAKLYAHLYETGLSESSYEALLSFSVNYDVKIKTALPKSDIAKMLDAIDRETKSGKRAYAAMMLGTVLGLRACDVVNLKLTDIDWINGEIRIFQSKTAKSVILPLTKDVGEALEDYILNARPKIDSPNIFIRVQPPYKALKSAVTIGEIYRDCCKTAGLPVSKRFHSLRRSLGTSMVNAGIPVTAAAQVFGDTKIDSMKQYIAVDAEHLKLCALPFDGIAPRGGDAA